MLGSALITTSLAGTASHNPSVSLHCLLSSMQQPLIFSATLWVYCLEKSDYKHLNSGMFSSLTMCFLEFSHVKREDRTLKSNYAGFTANHSQYRSAFLWRIILE